MPTTVQQLNRIYRRTYWRLTVASSFFCLFALVASFALLATNPKVATWISDAAQAEYVGMNQFTAPDTVRQSMPDQPLRQANAN